MLPHVNQAWVMYKVADLWTVFCIVSVALFYIILLASLWGEFVVSFLLLGICVSHDWTFIETMFSEVSNKTRKKMDYHAHFHSVKRVLDGSFGVRGRHFVCGQSYCLSPEYFISADCEIVLSAKLHEYDDFHMDCIWVGADKDICFSCFASR